MDSVTELFSIIPAAVSALTAIVTGALAVVGLWKAHQRKQAFDRVSNVAYSIIAALEMLPANEHTAQAKAIIQQIAETTEAESEALADMVDVVENLFEAMGVPIGGDIEDPQFVAEAAEVVKAAREAGK